MLSIIILTRNEEKNIGRMLNSILVQRFKDPYEIVVVDADSEDKTRTIIMNYSNRLPVRIVDGEGKGIGSDRNIGGYVCKGDILFFTEGDCFLKQGFLDQIQQLFKDSNLVAWSTVATPINSSGLIQLTYKVYNVCRYLLTRVPYPLKGYSLSGAILVIRQKPFHDLGGFQDGFDMNDDGYLGRKIRDNYRGKNQFMFCLDPKYVLYREVERFQQGYFKTLNHYIYVLVNFFPFLVSYLKNQIVYEGKRFKDEN